MYTYFVTEKISLCTYDCYHRYNYQYNYLLNFSKQ